jgi:DNA-binding beta-propeller fold protein YncE
MRFAVARGGPTARKLVKRRLAVAFAGLLTAAMLGLAGATAATPVRGTPGDRWADIVLGQPDFGQITPNQVTARRLFNPGGVIVDRSVRPARVYVYDGGNSRVLGLSHLGHIASGPDAGKPCTSDSDAPGSSCVIDQGRGADLVFGQPDFTHSGCNGDGNFQTYPVRAPASASTLCSMPEDQVSPLEGGSFAEMAVDPVSGDLYVPDFDNHRVLLYRSPFTTDTIADGVWGQADFTGNACNRGRGVGAPDAESLCFRSPTNDGFVAGVALDPSGNLWVADNENNRVLRFPHDSATGRPAHVADLVLGQPDFTSAGRGGALNQMSAPAAVRVAANGIVYVADSLHVNNSFIGRVLVFTPPLTSGMAATGTLGSGFKIPTGLEFDPGTGGLWVSDRINNQLLLFVNGQVSKVLFKDVEDDGGHCGGAYTGDGPNFFSPGDNAFVASYNVCDSAGSIGIDADGNVLAAGASFIQDVWRFPAPFPDPTPGVAHSADARLFPPFQFGVHNEVGLAGIYSARGVAVAKNQVIVADSGRLLFWNDPGSISNGQPADGFVGASDPRLEPQPPFGRIRNDGRGRLWAIRGDRILVYALPLTTGADKVAEITSPVRVLGGGQIDWNDLLAIGGIAPNSRGTLLWVADPRHNRVFRIRDPLTDPVVDVVIGQNDATGTGCNYGRDPDIPDIRFPPLSQSRDSLCEPGSVVLDHHGNVWVSDSALEFQGNRRLLEYDASLFRGGSSTALFAPPATRVFGTNGSFTSLGCQDALCGPWEPAFSSRGQMVVGLNGIFGQRFPIFYDDPLHSATPSGALNDFGSMPYAATFDSDDNLYVADLNRDRVFVYLRPFERRHH